jgi:hypothetical protein
MADDFFNLFIRNFNKLDLKDRVDYHQNHPDVSFAAYKKQKLKEITHAINPIKKVYLDTKFWIEIRDVIYKSGKEKAIVQEIFLSLKEKIADHKIICPFSTALFDELLKQGDLTRRKRTAQIADILTCNYSISPLYYIIGCETYNFISTASGRQTYQTDYIWTKALSVLGDISFNVKGDQGIEQQSLLLQKAYLDYYFQHTFQEVTAFNDQYQESNESATWHAGMLNYAKTNNTRNVSLEALHREELSSTFTHAADGMRISLNTIDIANQLSKMTLKEIREVAPVTYIYTLIYASLGRDKNRTTKPNDYYDISHSSLAVGTCDYFFAEKSFSTLLKSLKLDQNFRMTIASDYQEILELIKGIN